VQWLADRGYLVVQVNFRGSTGYGSAFYNAGNREWGAAMQADVLDVVAALTADGTIDPARVGIMGTSYGGYAALLGVLDAPAVFRCAIDLMGPADLPGLLGELPAYWSPFLARLHHRIGHPERDAALLRERSPLTRIADLSRPVLIGQGAQDPRVRRSGADRLVARLRALDLPHEYLHFDDEGHTLVKAANRVRFYRAAERFLADHLRVLPIR
jgi:dipeptidyl aminopeptidase/acylaminoacyl peptidase